MSTEKGEDEEAAVRHRVGEHISSFRRARGFDQRSFAEKIGKKAGVVSGWETGSSLPDLASVAAIAQAFGHDVWQGVIDALEGATPGAGEEQIVEVPPPQRRDYQRGAELLRAIFDSGNAECVRGIMLNLEAIAEHATRASPGPLRVAPRERRRARRRQ